MNNIQIIGGIAAEPSAIKEEFPTNNNAHIVEISAEDIMTINTEDNGQQEELKINPKNNIVEIGIEDIRDVEKNKLERKKTGTIKVKPIKEEPVVEITAEDIDDTNPEERVRDTKEDSNNNNIRVKISSTTNVKDNVGQIKQKVSGGTTVKEKLILNDAYEDLLGKTSKNKSPKTSPAKKRKRKINRAGTDHVSSKEYVLMKDKKYQCTHCKEVLISKKGIVTHIRHYHRDDSIYYGVEEKLKKNLGSSNYVAWYEYRLKEKDVFICNHCQEVVQGNSQMRIHIKMKHKTGKIIKCPYCPYTTRFDLKSHILHIHTEEKDIEYFHCDQCKNSKFKRKNGLKRHMRQVHTKPEDKYKIKETCPKCSKTFTDSYRFRRHMLEIHEPKITKFKCFRCNFECKTKDSFKHHNETRHSNMEELETMHCYHCPFKTKNKTRLRAHFNCSHRRTLQCHICSYQCTDSGKLKLHLISHKDEKDDKDLKYKCDLCEYRTYRNYSLKVHQLNHLKPEEIQYFYCYHCDFKAKRKDNLKTHIFRTHKRKEEESYKCSVCDFTTTKQHQLVIHVNKHKKEESKSKIISTTRKLVKTTKNINGDVLIVCGKDRK